MGLTSSHTSDDGPRQRVVMSKNPIFKMNNGKDYQQTFSLASNVVDFGIRAYLIRPARPGYGIICSRFSLISMQRLIRFSITEQLQTPTITKISKKEVSVHAFPDVIDVMIRVLTAEGSSALAAYEEGLIPTF